MLRTSLALACLLSLSACFSSRPAPMPDYESGGIRIFKTSKDFTHKKGAYVFGGLMVQSNRKATKSSPFSLVMEYGRDTNGNQMLESEEVIDTDRIQDGQLPFTYRLEELVIQPGTGRAIQRLRIEFEGEDAFRYERREQGTK